MEALLVARNPGLTDLPMRGAKDKKISLADRWKSYIAYHRITLRNAFKKLLVEPVQTLLTVTVIAIALALPSAMFLMLKNVEQLGSGVQASAQLSVFIKKGVTSQQIKQVQKQISDLPKVFSVDYISADQALQEFKALSGFGQALTYLDDNPLPAVFLVQPIRLGTSSSNQVEQLVTTITSFNAVDEVLVDMLWLQRLSVMTDISQKLVLAMVVSLIIGVLLVIGNTIRLGIHSRKEEIVVVKLIGATDAYVRLPFLYSGFLLGLLGGLMASILLVGSLLWIGQSVSVLAALYQSKFDLTGLGFSGVLGLCALGSVIGLCGAWMAVMQHLRTIEPR
jgi:cell division transport system permease protein